MQKHTEMTTGTQNSGQHLKGRVAVVTGASLGIGRATAIALGRAGAKVVVNYRSHAKAADEVIHEIEQAGSQAIKYQADVADQAAVEEMIATTTKEFGGLDIAISNAAYSDREPFHTANMDGFHRTVNVTMWGAFHLLRAATQQMISQGKGGNIVIVSSPLAFVAFPNSMAYNMSKAALEQMVKTAALEVAEHQIRVNSIQPGWIDTPGERKFASEAELETESQKIPAGRLGTSDEMAAGIMFLCDPAHTYMTGATLLMDGGISLPWWAQRSNQPAESHHAAAEN